MAPPLLTLRNIHLSFGATPLFQGADMAVLARERLCLVGRNGSGKSTLLKIAAGQVAADSGDRFLQPGTTVRYLPQEPDLTSYPTVLEYVQDGLAEGDDPHRVQVYLDALGLSGRESTTTLSGGEARRAALVRSLAPEPDILLLDEPTNHLDLPAIEWLEQELSNLRSAMVMISHDRRFLETLSNATLWVDRGHTKLLSKGFGAFEDWRDKLIDEEELDAHKLDRKIVREEHWVTHGVSGRRKRNMKRLGDLASLRKQRADRIKPTGAVSISVVAAEASGKLVAQIKNVSKSYDERCLVKDFSLRLARGERLGVVGPNGVGKTTLVNLLTGQLTPDYGTVTIGANVEMQIIDQKREKLKSDMSVKDALTGGGTDVVAIGDVRKHFMAYMKDFLFLPEQAGTPVQALSGGERGRLTLAMQLRHPSNLLVLDEPTNDLDLETLDLLQEIIADYDGTAIIVSHDRDFLDRVCTSVIVPEGKGLWREYAGGYSDMLGQRSGNSDAKANAGKLDDNLKVEVTNKVEKAGSARLTFKDKHALQTLPVRIEELESDIGKLNRALAQPGLFDQNPARFNKLAEVLAIAQSDLVGAEEQWLELELKREELDG